MTDSPSTPAGWYPAPHANNEQRYWDGEKWLDWTPEQAAAAHTQPAATAAQPASAPVSTGTVLAPPAKPKKKGLKWWAWVLIALGALILLIVIIGSINGGNRDDDDRPAAGASEPAEEEPSEEPSEEPAEEEPAEEEPVVSVEPQEFSGTGDMVVEANVTAPAIVTFACPGCTRNTVLKTNGAESLLVNTIGAYSGQKLINVSDGSMTTRFTVEADGAWTINVVDITAAEQFTGAASGSGDRVIFMSGDSDVAAITNDGERNFVVLAYGDGNFSPLVVNEIGAYSGTVEMSVPAFVEVTSTGNWSITPQ